MKSRKFVWTSFDMILNELFWLRMSMTTLREFEMLQFMNSVTDKPDWHIKVRCRSVHSYFARHAKTAR